MESEQENKQQKPGRMEYDVKNTLRTMEPESIKDSNTSLQNSTSSPAPSNSSSTTKVTGKPGRGWHGDSQGHAKAGSQSHKKSKNNES